MANQKLVRSVPLNAQLQDILKSRIRDGIYPPESNFPSEKELVNEFNISRATVRSALAVLETEGHIVRRHGVGTYVSKLSVIKNPINRVMEFSELISSGGYKPGVHVYQACVVEADDILESGRSEERHVG